VDKDQDAIADGYSAPHNIAYVTLPTCRSSRGMSVVRGEAEV